MRFASSSERVISQIVERAIARKRTDAESKSASGSASRLKMDLHLWGAAFMATPAFNFPKFPFP
jgi:hypothetical protein